MHVPVLCIGTRMGAQGTAYNSYYTIDTRRHAVFCSTASRKTNEKLPVDAKKVICATLAYADIPDFAVDASGERHTQRVDASREKRGSTWLFCIVCKGSRSKPGQFITVTRSHVTYHSFGRELAIAEIIRKTPSALSSSASQLPAPDSATRFVLRPKVNLRPNNTVVRLILPPLHPSN